MILKRRQNYSMTYRKPTVSHMGNLASTVQSASKLEAENEILQKKVDALKQSKTGDAESITRLEKEVSAQKETIEVLKKAEEETKNRGTVCASTERKLQSVNAELLKKRDLLTEVTKLNQQYEVKLKKLKDKKEANVVKCTADEEAIRQSQQQMEELVKTHAKEVKALTDDLVKAQKQKPIETLTAAHAAEMKKLQAAHALKMEAEKRKANAVLDKLQTNEIQWEATRKSLKQDNKEAKIELEKAEQTITDLKKTASKTEQLAKRLKDERNQLKDILLELKYKKFQVNNTVPPVSIDVVPKNKYSLKINHIDVHPAGFAQITYHFSDNTDVFRFKGNGGLEFVNSKKESQRFGIGSHGLALKQHLGLRHDYQVICSSVAGKNTWEFKSPPGVSKIVLTEQSTWGGLRDATLSKVG